MADLTSPRQYTARSRWAVENRLSDEGCRVLGAALIFCDQLVDTVDLQCTQITPVGLRNVFGPQGLALTELTLSQNKQLGDSGLEFLAVNLCPCLCDLRFDGTGCGNRGMAAMATGLAGLPYLQTLACGNNQGVKEWACLGKALSQLPALETLSMVCNELSSVDWLVAALAQCTSLRKPDLTGSNIHIAGANFVGLTTERALLRLAWGTVKARDSGGLRV